ncbi:hypothetical protein P171DRAFT_438541 [Karstenula rhodostoma CBS 690.94]|uniref:Uncharacterized protein n=1 Tax=Karstenula rhodostoma CBS 690.94 TaxID=1392251 RepID=A0A9P4UK10_9PLEO|nr:hypothetical protein P171DRAFT_438541 [Karstenula rhodostoma CBS 690.94]
MKTAAILSTLLSVALAAPAAHLSHSKRQGQNFQTFTGALGGIAATPITDSGNPDRKFQVKGDTFVNIGAALQRSCDQQFNACANKANGGDKTLSVSACSDQKTQCDAAGQGNTGASADQATATAASTIVAANPCDTASATATAAAVAASTTTPAAKNPCDTASANIEPASSTVAAAAAASSTNTAKKPCDTASASASDAGNSNKNKGDSNNGADASANAAIPCDKTKRFAGNKKSTAERRAITRRFKVA